MLSGFVMAYGYGRSNKPIDVSEFLIKRWANLYPLYIFSVLAGYLLIPSQNPQPLGLLVIMLLGLSGFVPSAFINDINTPGWTIGSLFILYAIFPFAVRMFKACSSKVKIFVVMPLLFTCSIGKPLADLSVNLGVLSGMARIAALASVPDFLQGINRGLLFLEHDWSKHPLIFQKFGLSASLAAACALFVMVDLQDLPIFCQLWRPYGMLQFLWMPVGGMPPMEKTSSRISLNYLSSPTWATPPLGSTYSNNSSSTTNGKTTPSFSQTNTPKSSTLP